MKIGILILLLLLSFDLQAAEMEFRTWTSASGTTIEAKCVSNFAGSRTLVRDFKKSKVTLETKDGRRMEVSFTQLSKPDQRWLMARFTVAKVGAPGEAPPPRPGLDKPSFKVLTEKDVNDPAKLLLETTYFDMPGRMRDSRRFLMSGLKPLAGKDFGKVPEWAVMAGWWIETPYLMGLEKGKTLDQEITAATVSKLGWWKEFKEPRANELMRFLAANNRMKSGLVGFEAVSCRTDIPPTLEELSKINKTTAYAELKAVMHTGFAPDQEVVLVVDFLIVKDFEFIHGGVCYQGELERIDRDVTKRFGIRVGDAWCVKRLRVVQKADPAVVPVLANRMEQEEAVLLIGEKFGKMMTICPHFILPK